MENKDLLLQLIRDEQKAREPFKGILGRSTDGLVSASNETGETNTYYAQIEDAPDPRIVYGDPSVLNLYGIDNTYPAKFEYEDGKLMIRGISASAVSNWYRDQTPSINFLLSADSGTQSSIQVGNTLTLSGGTGIDTSISGTAFTIALETPVSMANGGNGVSLTGLTTGAAIVKNSTATLTAANWTSGALIKGAGTGAPTFLTPTTNGHVVQVVAGAFASAALDIANVTGTLFTLSDNTNTQTITSGNTLKILGGTGITSTVGATDTATIAIDSTVVTLTGSQILTNKTLTAPTIADFTNMQHDHLDTDDGGTLSAAAIASGTLDNDRISWAAPGALGSSIPNNVRGLELVAARGTDASMPYDTDAPLRLSATYTGTTSQTNSLAYLNYIDNKSTAATKAQVLRIEYTRQSGASAVSTQYDASLVFVSNFNESQASPGFHPIVIEGPIIASGKTLATYGALVIGDSSGAGAVTTAFGLLVQDMSKATTNYAIYTGAGMVRLGGNIGFYGTAPVAQQTGGAATADLTYSSNERDMLNAVWTAMRNYGLLT